MEYILIKPVGLINSEKRAAVITRELYNIERPLHLQLPEEAQGKMFGIMQHPTNTRNFALRVDTNHLYKCIRNATWKN